MNGNISEYIGVRVNPGWSAGVPAEETKHQHFRIYRLYVYNYI